MEVLCPNWGLAACYKYKYYLVVTGTSTLYIMKYIDIASVVNRSDRAGNGRTEEK